MARGWESKAVEAQQDAAAENRRRRSASISDEEIRARPPSRTALRRGLAKALATAETERATLMLARTRALSDLQHACAPAHRAMLEQAIADLDQRLKALET
jgi:hypothetical protein